VHGILLCQAESADAVRAFVESCRYPHHSIGVDPSLPSPIERMCGAVRGVASGGLDLGTRGRGSEMTAAGVWNLSPDGYIAFCEPWPLNAQGELLLGVKLESPEGIAYCEEIVAVPGLGFAEMGPGDLGLALGYVAVPRDPLPAGDAGGSGARLRGMLQTSRRVSRDGHAGEHSRQARRGGSGYCRTSRRDGDSRPRPPETHNAGVAEPAPAAGPNREPAARVRRVKGLAAGQRMPGSLACMISA
jgi:HpcH/HpaI aldolase/citrate lyase family protein